MKKRFLLLFFLLLIACSGWAQKVSDDPYAFNLNGHNIRPEANITSMKERLKAKFESKSAPQKSWCIIQFNSLPTQSERNQLKSQGIELLNYIHGNAYFASISPKSISVTSQMQKRLRAFIDVKPEFKINQDLLRDSIPDYAKDGDLVKVVIAYFKDADVQELIKSSPVKLVNYNIIKGICHIYASIDKSQVQTLAAQEWVLNVELVTPPAVLQNRHGKSLHRANVLQSTIRGLGYGLTGKGVTIGLWDADVCNHRDFNDRVTVREFEMHTTPHGTHTCGTIAGAGLIDPKVLGMAPETKVYSWNFNMQSNGLTVPQERLYALENDGIEITSNSWGAPIATCPNSNKYNSTDQEEDDLACKFPYFLYVFAAGNDQSSCPGSFYTTTKNMKNTLIVAALDRSDNMSDFSSFGPSYDGRLIPNISGDGVAVYSTFFDNGYGFMDGTSMSTPGVAGTMALVYQRYKETHGGERPLSSLMRALACNTAYDLGNPGPDYKFGYGEINGVRAVEVMDLNHYFIDSVEQGTTIKKNIVIPTGAVAVKVMLAWTDPYGVSQTDVLVNDLDLSITNGGTTTLPWVLDPLNPSATATHGVDKKNNLEQVTIDNPAPGTYTINVNGSAIAEGKQTFAVVYDIVMPSLKLTYPIGGEHFTPADKEVIRWDCAGYDKTFTIEYSKDGGVNYTVIASNIPSNVRSYVWAVPGDISAMAKIRISNGSTYNVDKGTFSIMPTPNNLQVEQAMCSGDGPFALQWDTVPNAKYEVLKLNGQVYEHFADAVTNSYAISGLTHSNDNWFCVRAIDLTTGAISERSLAVTVNPTAAVTSLPYKQDFESQYADNFYFTSVYGHGSIQYISSVNRYGIFLEGTTKNPTDWVDSTGAACFTSNPNYIITASMCNLDASSLTGKPFRLKFDYGLKFLYAAGTSYLRVKVNGEPLANTDGITIYGEKSQESYKTVYYDLSKYAGNANVKIEFEAVCTASYINNRGDIVAIDNIEISEPSEDIALTKVIPGTGTSATESITVKVKNLAGVSVSNIPVSYSINGNAPVSEVINGPVDPLAEVSYSFSKTADFSTPGLYTVSATVTWPNDPVQANNTLTAVSANNGSDILIGSATKTQTCSAVLVDPGGRYANYPNSTKVVHTFVPGEPGKNIKVTFTEFSMEYNYDGIIVYNGKDTYAPRIGAFTGYTLPPSITSTADGGELTFKFISDNIVNDTGFVANIECVDKANIDATVLGISNPVSGVNLGTEIPVTIALKNKGLQALTNLDVYYKVNSNEPVHEQIISSLVSLNDTSYTFNQKADLSTIGTYTITAWVSVQGDIDTTNNSQTVTVINTAETFDAGIWSISNISPHINGALTSISATITNYGNKPLTNIPVAYSLNGTEVAETYADTLDVGYSVLYTFNQKADLTALGTTFNIDVYTKLSGDADASNDKKSTVITTPFAPSGTNVVGAFKTGSTNVTGSTDNPFSLRKNFTVEFWMKPDKNPYYGTIFSKAINITHHSEYNSAAYGSNCLIIQGGGKFVTTPTNSIVNGKWQHVAVTSSFDGTIKVYINGVKQTLSTIMKVTLTSIPLPIRIGNNGYNQPYNGLLDEVRVWSTELDQTTIANNMMTNYVGNEPNLVAYYKFIEGNGNYVYDYSLNNNTALVTNADCSGIGDGKFWNTPGNLISSMNVTGEKISTSFDTNNSTFSTIMDNANLSSIAPNFTTSQLSVVKVGGDIQTSGVSTQDFSNGPITYTAEGFGFNAGISQTYTLKVVNDLRTACELTSFSFETKDNPGLTSKIDFAGNGNNFSVKASRSIPANALKASYQISGGATLYINGVPQSSPQTSPIDYSKPLMVTVLAENGRDFKNYSITLDRSNSEANLISFGILNDQVGTSNIDHDKRNVEIWVKNSANLSMLTSTFAISDNAKLYSGSIEQINGVTSGDYSAIRQFALVSEDEAITNDWTVAVTKDNISPVITLKGNATVDMARGSIFTEPGFTATDNVDGDVTSKVIVTGLPTNTSPEGDYTVRYNVTDAAGNPALEVTRVVKVVITSVPINDEVDNVQIYSDTRVIYINIGTMVNGCEAYGYSIIGNQVFYSRELIQGSNRLVGNLLPGIYLVKVKNGNKVYTKKVVITQ